VNNDSVKSGAVDMPVQGRRKFGNNHHDDLSFLILYKIVYYLCTTYSMLSTILLHIWKSVNSNMGPTFAASNISNRMGTFDCFWDVKRLSRKNYLFLVISLVNSVGLTVGYMTTLSGLLMRDAVFIDEQLLTYTPNTTANNKLSFLHKYLYLFYTGLFVGSLFTFFSCDLLGRKYTLFIYNIGCSLNLLWVSIFSYSCADLLSSRFFLGWLLGTLLPSIPIYISEVILIENIHD
jgi:hypothetical protein